MVSSAKIVKEIVEKSGELIKSKDKNPLKKAEDLITS